MFFSVLIDWFKISLIIEKTFPSNDISSQILSVHWSVVHPSRGTDWYSSIRLSIFLFQTISLLVNVNPCPAE